MTINLHGIFPPIPTPFENGMVAYDKLASNVAKWNNTGIRGFVVLGSNGEYVYLSEKEKRKTVETVVQAAAEDMPIIAGTGCESTEATISLTVDCAALGAHVALVITPHYYGSKMSAAALINHYSQVADQSPIPILLYNVPKFTHINLTLPVITELSKHPNIIGMKDSAGNVSFLGEILNHVAGNFSLLVGTAGVLFPGLALGCVGGVLALANVAPAQCVEIFKQVGEGQFEAAKRIQLKMIPVNKAITATYGIGGLKAALEILGYFGGEPRLPLLPSSENEKTEIRTILETAGLLA